MGRPRSVVTAEIEDAILRTVRLGLHADRAAQAHAVSPSTLRAHRRRNPDFATRLKEAEAAAEQTFLSRILQHTERQWTAAAWMLERRWPQRWRRRDGEQVEVRVGKAAGPQPPTDAGSLTDYADQFAAAAAALRRRDDDA